MISLASFFSRGFLVNDFDEMLCRFLVLLAARSLY
jgi:hypothetical protein